jgi:hypothetical protein
MALEVQHTGAAADADDETGLGDPHAHRAGICKGR